MTRREQTGIRDLTMSQWVRDNLPDSSRFSVTDIDFVLHHHKKNRVMIVEVKQHNSSPRFAQHQTLALIHLMLSAGAEASYADYRGYHVVQFEHTSFDDGFVKLDGNVVTEQALISFLSMED